MPSIIPQVIPQRGQAGTVGGGGTYYASAGGMNPASGAAGALSGPWLEEFQTLAVDYLRVPYGDVSANTLTLVGGDAQYKINATYLACRVQAYYSRRKTTANYATSSYQQPQKFETFPLSADMNGNSYGSLTVSTLGPMGSINTIQPWYYRRNWGDATDTEASGLCDGTTFFLQASAGTGGGVNFPPQWGQTLEMKNFYMDHCRPYTHIGRFDGFVGGFGGHPYWLPGRFNTGQETLIQIFNLLDNLGQQVSWTNYYAVPPQTSSFSTPMQTEGIPEYNHNYHDYT